MLDNINDCSEQSSVARGGEMWSRAVCFLSVGCLAFLVGCGGHGVNEGAVDYRFVQKSNIGKPISDNKLISLEETGKYHVFGINKSVDKDMQPIKRGDSVSIRLVQAYICDFQEKGMGIGNDGDCSCSGLDSAKTYTSGEIAVILNVCEENKEGCSISYDGTSIENGRLVFYSEDVRETGQYLNFSNLPVYGPITYEGSPLYIDMAIMELDTEEAEKGKAVLHTLAGLGGKAYPPADMVLKTLNTLGSAFLSGNQDDLEMRFRLNLEPSGGSGNVGRAPLTPGYYVFIRSERRNKEVPWEQLALDISTGRLQHKVEGTTESEHSDEYRDWNKSTYLVFKIDTNEETITQDSSQTFATFMAAQNSSMVSDLSEISAAFNDLESSLSVMDSKNRLRDVEMALAEGSTYDKGEKKRAVLDFVSSYCLTIVSAEGDKSLGIVRERFNILQQISTKSFNPEAHCANQSKYVNDLGLE